jgi:hypothetical protein
MRLLQALNVQAHEIETQPECQEFALGGKAVELQMIW